MEFTESNISSIRTIVREETDDMRSDISTLKSDVGTLKSDVSILKSDVGTLKSDVGTLKSDVSSLTTNMQNLKEEVGSMHIFMEEMNSNILAIAECMEVSGVEKRRMDNFENRMTIAEQDIHSLKQLK